MTRLNRRTFLTLSGGAAAAGLVVPAGLRGKRADALGLGLGQSAGTSGSNRVLVIVDLQGGNDALNTFVPQTGNYHDLRPTISLKDDELVTFRGLDYGVHPALARFEQFWDAQQLTAIYGSGIEGQGRSHFVAQDVWRTGRVDQVSQSGWMGRWLDGTATDGPAALRAVAFGQSALTTQGEELQPVAISSLAGFELVSPAVAASVLSMSEPRLPGVFGQAQAAIPDTVTVVGQIENLLNTIAIHDENDPDADSSLFEATQALIQADLGAQVITVTINGFDTHALQPNRQDVLLRLVANGLADMFDALSESGHADQTMAMVVSEFGRRVAENGSAGTDHGRGGLSFLLGPPVKESTVIGEPDLEDLINGDLRITTDAREMYDSALRWLGATDREIVNVLGSTWTEFDLVGST